MSEEQNIYKRGKNKRQFENCREKERKIQFLNLQN